MYKFITFFVLYITQLALSTNYYVSPTGNDNNPGTFTNPFLTIQKGIDVAMPGDTVFVLPGTYSPGINGLNMVRSGSAGNPIVFSAYDMINKPLIQFPNTNSPDKGWQWDGYRDYLEIHGFELAGSKWAILVQGNYNKITNCIVHNTGSDGLNIWGGSNNLISRNEVFDTGWNGIYIEHRDIPTDDNIVQYNYVHDCPSHFGVNIYPKSSLTQQPIMYRNIVRWNVIGQNNCGGIYLRKQRDAEIYGNLIFENGGSACGNGIFLHRKDGDTYPFDANLKVYNNTLVGNTPYRNISNDVFSNTNWFNNIVVDGDVRHSNGPTNQDYNLYWNASGDITGSNNVFADPLLNSNYTLTATSPAKDAGVDLGAPYNYDMFGNLRGADGTWDIGAFEFVVGGSNSPPGQPFNPNPSNGAIDQPVNLNLTWDCTDPDGDPLVFDVYFGTSSNPPLVSSNQSGFSYNPGSLNYSTTYYWRIVAKDVFGNTTNGNVWNFTTVSSNNSPPTQPNNPVPENNSLNQPTLLNLSWQCTDPDGDPLTYDVYFGTATNPPLAISGLTSNSYNPGQLNQNTTYFWKITAHDNQNNSTMGSVWNFTTIEPGGGDTISPRLIAVEVLSNTSIKLSFSEDILGGNETGNYTISNNITVNLAQYNNLQSTLTTSYHTPGQYLVTVSNITDLSGNLIDPDYSSLGYEITESSELILLNVVDVAASVVPERLHTPEKTIDGKGYYSGDPNSRWAGDTMPEWLRFDLGSERMISRTKLEFYEWNNGRIYNYTVQVSSDTLNWNTVLLNESSLTEQWTIKDFNPVIGRYLKLIFNSNNQNDWAGLWEAEIWGDGPTSTGSTDPLPSAFELFQNYPNPFNPSTRIKFSVPENSFVQLKVYNLIGEVVADLMNDYLPGGIYEVDFDAKDLPSGIYIYTLRAGEFITTKKMVLLQ